MQDLDEMIERRELEVRCWQCAWREGRTLSWLSTQRHMNCPECTSVIVLDTSMVRREIARHRRQLSALRDQMGKLFESAGKVPAQAARSPRITGTSPQPDLALAQKHPGTLVPYARRDVPSRRLTRVGG